MKILHTSDLHLKEGKEERFEALKEILKIAENEKVDYLTVSGDLFDSDFEAMNTSLRSYIRECFSDIPFKVLLIPGNHDKNTFNSLKYNFGENIIQMTDFDKCEIKDGGVRFVGIPYFEGYFDQVYPKLMSIKDDMINILLIHCTLDFGINTKSNFGDEEQPRYLPVSSSILKTLNFNYILAGHFHSKYHIQEISDSCTFIYPGSPVSITSKEEDKRSVILIDTDKLNTQNKGIKAIDLDTFYYKVINCHLVPNKEEEALYNLGKELKRHNPEKSKITVILKGHISLDESDFKEKTKKILSPRIELEEYYMGIKDLMNTDIYQRVMSKVNQIDCPPEEKMCLQEALTDSISRVLTGRKNED